MAKNIIILSILALGTTLSSCAMQPITRAEEIAREAALNAVKISSWNKTYRTSDGSIISATNPRIGTIAINDKQHQKKIILQIGVIPQGWRERIPTKLTYHPRIEQWSTVPVELLAAAYDGDGINNHTFPEMVDYVVQKFGTSHGYQDYERLKVNPQLLLAGRIMHLDTDESVSGRFEYTFFEDTPGVKILYHRFFRPS